MKRKSEVLEFDPARVRPLPGQPRKRFAGIAELAASIAEVGQTTPGIVTIVPDDKRFDAELVDGERRLRACAKAGVLFRAEVRGGASPEDLFIASFAANFGKQDHDTIEISDGLLRIQRAGKTIEQLVRISGRSVTWVTGHLSLQNLHPDVRAMMIPRCDEDEPDLKYSYGLLLTALPASEQVAPARKMAKGMTIAAARRLVMKERAKRGATAVYKNRSIETIATILKEAEERLGIYIDMPAASINELIDAVDNRSKRLLVEQIEDFKDTLDAVAEAIESRLPKAQKRTA